MGKGGGGVRKNEKLGRDCGGAHTIPHRRTASTHHHPSSAQTHTPHIHEAGEEENSKTFLLEGDRVRK